MVKLITVIVALVAITGCKCTESQTRYTAAAIPAPVTIAPPPPAWNSLTLEK